jgi:SEC-C motif-containing protein
MTTCPCGSKKDYNQCCEPYLLGSKLAPTAEALMRARYTAFAVGNMDFISKSHHESSRKDLDMEGVKSWASNSKWLGLEILQKSKGLENDTEGKVEFICKFIFNDQEQGHHELSTFKKEGNEWFFVDGEKKNSTIRRESPKVGRNDPCPCGSTKKAKKCCHQ